MTGHGNPRATVPTRMRFGVAASLVSMGFPFDAAEFVAGDLRLPDPAREELS